MSSGRVRALVSVAAAAVVAASLTACSSATADAGGGGGKVAVVASTDVWGDIASQIGGSEVDVTSIITSPDADPHSFEANAQVQLKLSRARVVIENGGGYDDFVDTMLKTVGGDPTVVNAVDVSGRTAPAGGELNEHVWYDLPSVVKVAGRISDALAAAEPSAASTFQANEQAFVAKVEALEQREAAIAKGAAGKGAAITEPVPVYMLDACGLIVKTPAEFSEAVEEGTDVPPAVLAATEAQFADGEVAVLAYNEQTTGAETEAVLAAAKRGGVPVVPVTETLPEGKDYLSWMSANLDALGAAVGA
ncbi:metal ABC transporter solute-binding protein, Zn/Mn family [Jatrophihabitans sp. YIM 134969]